MRFARGLGLVLAVALAWACGAGGAGRRVEGLLLPAPAMAADRAAHTATGLRDGGVLVAGGFVERGSARGAELFDPAVGRFVSLPPMRTTRHSHTATLLADGRVLIAGGYGEGAETLAAAELFDPRTNTFVATGALATPRADHVAVLLESGQVLVAGGLGTGWNFLASAELYDPVQGRFTPAGDMTTARESHVAVRMRDGRVLIVGGHNGRRGDLTLLTSAELHDPRTGAFTRVGDLGIRRHKHDAVLLADGRVLITGGSDERDERGVYDSSELFDPGTGRFTAGPRLQLGRYKHAGTSILLPDGRVLLAGGAPRAELFDPLASTFTLVPGDPRMAGQFSAAAALPTGAVLITGGYGNGTGPRSSAWLYRP